MVNRTAVSKQRKEAAPRTVDHTITGGLQPLGSPEPLKAAVGVVVAFCLMTSVVHVLFVFLHVAPSNEISHRYRPQIDGWIYPVFEQNWRLFAPEPESVNRQISARTKQTSADGVVHVSDWFDLSAVDDAAVEHNFFPSHTAHNMLRRAWGAYLETHGNDDQPHSPRAAMVQAYLRNIAVDRITAHRPGTFEAIQLRVITRPIPPPTTVDKPRPAPPAAQTRQLPWWTVTSNGN